MNPEHVLQLYREAVDAKDVDAYAGLYDDDIHVFDMWSDWSCTGLAAWRAMAADWFGSLGSERVAVDFDAVQTRQSGELAVIHAFMKFAAIAPDGTQLRSLDNRLTLVLRRDGAAWKIVHQHTSAPVQFGTLQASLSRAT